MIPKEQVSILREWMKHDGYELMLKLANYTLDEWQKQNVIGTTEFETLKLTFNKEFKTQALKEFLELLEKEASQ